MHRDRIVGVLTTILGAAVAYMTSQLAGTNMPGDPGPKVFPLHLRRHPAGLRPDPHHPEARRRGKALPER